MTSHSYQIFKIKLPQRIIESSNHNAFKRALFVLLGREYLERSESY